ncbi:MAG: sugar phosphate isomerase/epimerase family protein [Tepidisphaeraceae bacterium]|jgi:sugar phosphate isomerase/epimerase
MKLGFNTAVVPEMSPEEVFEFADQEDFDCIEVCCWPVGKAERKFAGVTHIDVAGFTKGRARDINEMCAESCVRLSALGYYPNPLDPDSAAARRCVDHLKKVIVAAEMLGLKNVNSFIGRDWTRTVDENWPRFLKTWKPLIAFAEDHDIRIGIENCPMSFTRDEWPGGKNLATSPVIWRRMFNDIPSRHFGLNYDPSHFILQFMDPIRPLKEFKDKLFHLHAKDVKIQHERLDEVGAFAFPLQWHQPRIPGYGDINWAEFMATLTEIGYTGDVCIEVEDDTFGKTLEGRQKALRVARNILAPFFDR